MRIRDTFADGINLTNDSTGNLVSNDEARGTGDDASRCSPPSTAAARWATTNNVVREPLGAR